MTKIKDKASALALFEKAAAEHGQATEQGDYKKANKCYSIIVSVINFLKEEDSTLILEDFINHSSVGVRMWAATYLLPLKETEAAKALEVIINGSGIHSLTAETTLNEWKKENSK